MKSSMLKCENFNFVTFSTMGKDTALIHNMHKFQGLVIKN